MQRILEPEWLDELPVDEPRAIRSRGDLRRLNALMDHAGILATALSTFGLPCRVVDLGSGDGTFALRLAQTMKWRGSEVVLVDRNAMASSDVRSGFAALDCSVTQLQLDVLRGLSAVGEADIVFSNLFLHHFNDADLSGLLRDVASHCKVFAACEPRRSGFALLASQLVALVGCNSVTRHDAVASVRAGFSNGELSRLWPEPPQWRLTEQSAGMFSHLFVARRL